MAVSTPSPCSLSRGGWIRQRWLPLAIVGLDSPSLGSYCGGWVGFMLVGLDSRLLASARCRWPTVMFDLAMRPPVPLLVSYLPPPPRVVSSSSSSSSSSCRLLLLLLVSSLPPPPHVVSSSSSSSASCRLPRGMISLCRHASCHSSSSPCIVSSLCVILIVSLFVLSFIVLSVCHFPPDYSIKRE